MRPNDFAGVEIELAEARKIDGATKPLSVFSMPSPVRSMLQRARKGDRRDPLLLTNVLWSFAHGVAVLTIDGNLKHGDLDAVLTEGLDTLIEGPKKR